MAYLTIREGFFNSNDIPIKNGLPIDINITYPNSRLIMLNTHVVNVMISNLTDKRSRIIMGSGILSVLASTIFNPLTLIVTLPATLVAFGYLHRPLLRQWDARDIWLVPAYINRDEKTDPIPDTEQDELNSIILNHPILSTNDGEVIYTYDEIPNDMPFDSNNHPAAGNHIIISHYGGKLFSLYGHLYHNSLKVKTGDKVTKGQHIAGLGNTGNSTGSHLHFELEYNDPRKSSSVGKRLENFDNYLYCPVDGISLLSKRDMSSLYNTPKLMMNRSGILHNSCFIN